MILAVLAVLAVLALASHSADSRLSGGEHDCAKSSLPARSPFRCGARWPIEGTVTSCGSLYGLREWRSETVFR